MRHAGGVCVTDGIYSWGQIVTHQFSVLHSLKELYSSLPLPDTRYTDSLYISQNARYFNFYSLNNKVLVIHTRQLSAGEAVQVVVYFQHIANSFQALLNSYSLTTNSLLLTCIDSPLITVNVQCILAPIKLHLLPESMDLVWWTLSKTNHRTAWGQITQISQCKLKFHLTAGEVNWTSSRGAAQHRRIEGTDCISSKLQCIFQVHKGFPLHY